MAYVSVNDQLFTMNDVVEGQQVQSPTSYKVIFW